MKPTISIAAARERVRGRHRQSEPAEIKLSREQRDAVADIKRRLANGQESITLGGLAGTGKTTIATRLPGELGLALADVAYSASTGKAASMLNRKLGYKLAKTNHGLIYFPMPFHCEKCPQADDPDARCHDRTCHHCGVEWERRDELEDEPQLVISDEASMVDRHVHRDVLSYGVPVVWIGDHGQLPPVKSEFKLLANPDIRLETVHRQVADSPVLALAMQARAGIALKFGDYGPGTAVTPLSDTELADFIPPDGNWEDWMNLCGKNDTRVDGNRNIRDMLGFRRNQPEPGDRVICLRTNYRAGVYNGQTGTVLDCEAGMESGYPVYGLVVKLDGERELYNGLALAEQFNHEVPRGTAATMSDMPKFLDLFDFAYVFTVHKAQGSEAKHVNLFAMDVGGGDKDSRQRWLYTGISRAQQTVTVIR